MLFALVFYKGFPLDSDKRKVKIRPIARPDCPAFSSFRNGVCFDRAVGRCGCGSARY